MIKEIVMGLRVTARYIRRELGPIYTTATFIGFWVCLIGTFGSLVARSYCYGWTVGMVFFITLLVPRHLYFIGREEILGAGWMGGSVDCWSVKDLEDKLKELKADRPSEFDEAVDGFQEAISSYEPLYHQPHWHNEGTIPFMFHQPKTNNLDQDNPPKESSETNEP